MKNEQHHVKQVIIDPTAIGLFGLAMVTLVASSQKLGWTENVSGVLPWAIFLGGIAQLIASNYDAKHNNVFGATAFAGYGLFWLGTGMSWMIQNGLFGEVLQASFDPNELGFAFLGYFIFTVFMTVGALETNKVLFFIFFLIDFLFLGLFMSTFGIATDFFHMMAAVAEFLISILSFYGAAAAVLNGHFCFTFLPIGKPFGIIKK
ncbi:hypothetical protein CKN82_07420 [Carnobacterium divergens]|uniref:acetate uptake transporter n=1 Tax=Carnobacterium divergens TaxID=2748 RepID=UPI0010720006|nr:GPR1/FUN34/YaaH family transporter [Carnobacterium divergens]MDT1995266.1 acetate uptake transporter [Carnobacterium divergens]TFI64058.1 hypothetical protein CKN59_08725 [Carnobacterium divergens]TFI64302.1 hypothetical protein CKN76_08735 [Carnobacterium divergens]TFI68864.1 hypothetical protein CKN70_07470 [Carnobacterium divergens]TFI79467.1 hypothetical protein CKN74_08700 [Carnobacterium divergens]